MYCEICGRESLLDECKSSLSLEVGADIYSLSLLSVIKKALSSGKTSLVTSGSPEAVHLHSAKMNGREKVLDCVTSFISYLSFRGENVLLTVFLRTASAKSQTDAQKFLALYQSLFKGWLHIGITFPESSVPVLLPPEMQKDWSSCNHHQVASVCASRIPS